MRNREYFSSMSDEKRNERNKRKRERRLEKKLSGNDIEPIAFQEGGTISW
jgi:hypothetical protein